MYNPSSINVYIDPQIKQSEKKYYSEIKSIAVKNNFKITDELSEGGQFPQLIFYHHSSVCLVKESHFAFSNFVVKIPEPNLSFFSSESSEDVFLIQKEDDIELAFYFFKKLLDKVSIERIAKLEEYSVSQLKEIKKRIKNHTLSKDMLELIDQFEEDIYNTSTLLELIETIEKKSVEYFDISIQVKKLNEILTNNILVLDICSGFEYFIEFDVSEKDYLLLYTIYYSIVERMKLMKSILLTRNNAIIKQNDLNNYENPIVVYGQDQNLILQNRKFSELNISTGKCFSLRDSSQISIDEKYYYVKKFDFQIYKFFTFFQIESKVDTKKTSSEELGIVSSSIAHEINNPLGGILAAIDVLLLDDYEDVEVPEKLMEMKEGVIRSKKLVETILGFSKLRHSYAQTPDLKIDVKECLNQALDLLRFRLIEDGIQFRHDFQSSNTFKSKGNPHILTMIIYLIFGELITSKSHQSLVEQSEMNKIMVTVSESVGRISLELTSNVNSYTKFWNSKLFNHLLSIENLSLNIDANKILIKSLS
jgi:hypothetical protein